MKNEDTTGVVKPQMKGQTIAKRNETKKHTMNYKTIHHNELQNNTHTSKDLGWFQFLLH